MSSKCSFLKEIHALMGTLLVKICAPGMKNRKLAEVSTIRSALSKHLEAIEHRFCKFQIGSTEESLEAIEKEESAAVVAQIFGAPS